MPIQTLPARTYIYFPFDFASVGWLHQSTINFHVVSERPIDMWIVDAQGFQQFHSGGQFSHFGGFNNITENKQNFRVPQAGTWYLIVHNLNYESTPVYYDVSQT